MPEYGFSLGLEKSEIVVLSKERLPTVHPIQVAETIFLSKPAVKYLDIVTNTKMRFFEQICNTVDNAAARIFAIC